MSVIFNKISNGFLTPSRKKLKPIIIHKKSNINTLSNRGRNQKHFLQRNISQGELSVLLFQGNDVDLVRSLNPDQDRDICSNILLKGQLKNNIIKNNEYNIRTTNKNNSSISLPKIKKITINGILESEQRLNQNKKEAQKNLAYSQLEGELCGELKKIRSEYNKKREEKNNIYIKYKEILDKIDEMNLEIQLINSKSFMDNLKEQKMKQKEENKMLKENIEKTKIKQNLLKRVSKQLPNFIEGLDLDKLKDIENEENKKNNNNGDIENKMNKIKNLYQMKKETDFQKRMKFDKINMLKEELNKINEPLQKINK